MNSSYIYENMNREDAVKAGYFDPKSSRKIVQFYDGNEEMYTDWGYNPNINKDTLILYYPGSFGVFHNGHMATILEAINAAKLITKNFIAVIAPSNSDYLCEKYGEWSVHSSNIHRYNSIKKAHRDFTIDLEPMLNYTCDQNFTDLLQNFVFRTLKCDVKSLTHKPWIICGKDRENFKLIENFSDDVNVYFAKDVTGASTSALVNNKIDKKHLMLRVKNHDQYRIFEKYFSDQYLSIEPIILEDEKYLAYRYAKVNGIKYTNCREYQDILNYVPISRKWVNPFLQSKEFIVSDEYNALPPGQRILDSDIFTGSTQKFVNDAGHELHALMNFSIRKSVELVDIWDFEYKMRYPIADVSSRCSMRAFDFEMHKKIANFHNECFS